MTTIHDVVVVGGGLAGLSAGRSLRNAGIDAVVVEARDRVGGKSYTAHTDYGDVVEYGGQWVGADQEHVLSLIDAFDIDTRPQYDDGAVVSRVAGQRYVEPTYMDALRALPGESGSELLAAFEEIARCIKQIPGARPQNAPHADEWDAMTLQTWIDQQFETPEAQAAFERMIPGIYTADPSDISFLFFCYYARTAGGFHMVAGLDEEEDSHTDVVVDVQSIAQSVADELGDAVHCGHPVTRIEQDDDSVRVQTPERTYTASYVVVAVPPTLAGRIDYEPALPAARDELMQRMPNGTVVKCHVRYVDPFWRDSGFSGLVEDDVGPVNYFFDDGHPDGETGRLVGFICGSNAREWADKSTDERRVAVIDQLVSLFDDDRFDTPIDYLDQSWPSDPYSRGAYHGYPTPGTMTACWDAIREPVGRIHWAGAETATRWYGHMDGAIRSGRRAADEIQFKRSA
ncbi:flavin monoamine oxidase family protein [Haloferax sp. DFSO52]|uniref:flavin monoamine oxidase family protein n=1 Tax=Haloferax sp. DFSO52 TaxID=3388505 RepID=UPI003A873B0B